MVIKRVYQVLMYLIIVAVTIMMLITVADVSGRYLFSSPIQGTVELVRILLAVTACCSIAYAQFMKRHIRLDFIFERLSSKRGLVIDGITLLLAVVVMSFVTYGCIDVAITQTIEGEYEMGLVNFPIWPGRIVIALSFVLLTIQFALHMVESFRLALRK